MFIFFSEAETHPNEVYGKAEDGGSGKEGDTAVDVEEKKVKKGILKRSRSKSEENGQRVTFVTASDLMKEEKGRAGGSSKNNKKGKKSTKKSNGPRKGSDSFIILYFNTFSSLLKTRSVDWCWGQEKTANQANEKEPKRQEKTEKG